MNARLIASLPLLTLGLGACGEDPVEPAPAPAIEDQELAQRQGPPGGTGLVLESVSGVTVPLIGETGEVVIDQAVITGFGLIEDAAGQIVGVEAEGVLTLTGGVLGTDVVTEEFTTEARVVSSGPGQCEVVTIDLAPIEVGVLDPVASVDVPEAEVAARGSGAVGSLLCNLGNLLGSLTGAGGIVPGVGGIVNALNGLL